MFLQRELIKYSQKDLFWKLFFLQQRPFLYVEKRGLKLGIPELSVIQGGSKTLPYMFHFKGNNLHL